MMKESFPLLLVFCVCASAQNFPSTCLSTDCPDYDIVAENGTYQLRKYVPSYWVKTQGIYTGNLRRFRFNLFMKLFAYIRGENDQNVRLKMTAPVLTMYQPGLPVQMETKVTMYFMLPKSVWGKAPIPTEPDVILDDWPETQFYVRSYQIRGYATEEVTLAEYNTLKNALGYNGDYAITAGYDKPSKEQNRHNEIWFIKV